MPLLAVCAFAVAWWLGCYLVARDPGKPVLHRAAAALITYALGVALATAAAGAPDLPLHAIAQMLLCVPALAWAGTAVGLLADDLPERRQINRGWLLTAALLLVMVPALPSPGRLVVLAPLAGALVLLWRFRDGLRPTIIAGPLTVGAALYALGLAAILLPIDLGAPTVVLAAMGIDVVVLGLVAAVADADDEGERLGLDLRRSFVAAFAAIVLIGGPAAFTLTLAKPTAAVTVLQFLAVAAAMTGVTLGGAVRQVMDRLAFVDDPTLRDRRAALLVAADALPRRRDRDGIAALGEDEFARLTRRALRHLDDPARLLRSPLLALPAVDRRLVGRGVTFEQPLARAAELRGLLCDCITGLKPNGSMFGTTDDWRHYNALYFWYVVGLRPHRRRARHSGLDQDARRALDWFRRYVPRRSLRRWRAAAVQLVAAELWADLTGTDPPRLTAQGPPVPPSLSR